MGEADTQRVLDAVADALIQRASAGRPLVVGLTGSVAAGKTTLCGQLADKLGGRVRVEALSTDGFLLPNALLNERGLSLRKGFPESYDADALFDAVARVRRAPTAFPGYSHQSYDVDPDLTRIVDPPDILLLEGLGFSPFEDGRSLAEAVDLLIYIDADEADLEEWFVERFMGFWRAAEEDAASFYAQFRHMSSDQAETFGRMVWTKVNLPNLRENIVRVRDKAEFLLRKTRGHRLRIARCGSPGDGL